MSFVNTIPYLLFIAVFAGLGIPWRIATEQKKFYIGLVCFVLYVLFWGLRGYVGYDWITYKSSFDECGITNLTYDYEFGFSLLMLACKLISNNFHFFLFTCTIINALLLFRFFLKWKLNLPLGICLFLCIGGLLYQVNFIRNIFSLLIFINTIDCIYKRKPWRFFLLNILGAMFHISSLFYLLVYPFFHKKCPKKVFLIILVVCNIIPFLDMRYIECILNVISDFLDTKLAKMLNDYFIGYLSSYQLVLSVAYVERFITGLLVYFFYDKLLALRKENVIFINSFLLYYIMFFVFSEYAIIGTRMANLFVFCYWILWIDLFFVIKSIICKYIYSIIISFYCLTRFGGTVCLDCFKYDNVLFGIKPYSERVLLFQNNDK